MSRDEREVVRISREDLSSEAVTAAVARAQEAAQVPLRREIGSVTQSQANTFDIRGPIIRTGIACALAGVAAALVYELFFNSAVTTISELYQHGALTIASETLLFAAAIASLHGFEEGSAAKAMRLVGRAALPALFLGGLAGVVATWLFVELSDGLFEAGFNWVRGLAWAIAFVGIGVAVGFAFRSTQKMMNGLIGGSVGAFVGGGLFDLVGSAFTTSATDTGTVSRLVGFVLVGSIAGAAIGFAEAVRKSLWLQVVSGGMAGKQFIVYQQAAVLGSSPTADITLIKDPRISPEHVVITQRSGGATFAVTPGSEPVLLNGEPRREGPINAGALLQVGTTVLQFGEQDVVMPTMSST